MQVRRIRQEAVLIRLAREFFETQLLGIISLGETTIAEASLEKKIPGRRQLPREVLEIDFPPYRLVVKSSNEAPPLGEVELEVNGAGTGKGTLDTATWATLGKIIREGPRPLKRQFERKPDDEYDG